MKGYPADACAAFTKTSEFPGYPGHALDFLLNPLAFFAGVYYNYFNG